jgi:hypothetical protein
LTSVDSPRKFNTQSGDVKEIDSDTELHRSPKKNQPNTDVEKAHEGKNFYSRLEKEIFIFKNVVVTLQFLFTSFFLYGSVFDIFYNF